MSSRLVLIRHADVRIAPDTPADRWGLSPEGQRAAAELSRHAIVDSVELFFSSPEPKALATAYALARGRPIVQIAALRELDRSSAGFLESRADYVEMVRTIFRQPREQVRGYEAAADARQRIVQAIDRIVRDHPGKTLAIVSHGIVLTLYLSHLRGLSAPDFVLWQRIRLPDLAVVDPGRGRVLQAFGGREDDERQRLTAP